MISTTNQLNEQQLKDLEALRAICKKADGSIPNLYMHLLVQPRTLPTILLYYRAQQLIGFLSVYFFYDDAVEIALLVHPEERQQGIGKKLLQTILPLVVEHHYAKIIFSSPAHLNNRWFNSLGFVYRHSEYYMERNNLNPLLDSLKSLSFRTANFADIPQLCLLDEACFHKTHAELEPRFMHILSERNYQIILAFENDKLVGKAHLRWQNHGATLSDIAVFPKKQGQGLGTALITYCINYALSEGKPELNLDVETHNKKALELYTRLGFLTQNACDYWMIDIEKIHQWVNS
ncbi:MAG: GNAT family N-acetyltransferase [Legionella sp. 40-6]|nr:GNAT family N-acetyltransferase [Legionella sp.]OJY39787.1 MAG: GNAT family N-acetyltransferase [Legionella sp. 40-6]